MKSVLEQILAEQRRRQDAREDASVNRMTTFYAGVIDTLDGEIRAVTAMIERARADGTDVNPDWLRRQARYQLLQGQAQELYTLYADEGDRTIRDARIAEVRAGSVDAIAREGIYGPLPENADASINQHAVERMVHQLSEESPVRDSIRRWGLGDLQAIDQHLVDGVANGYGADKIVRNIRRDLTGDVPAWRVRTLVRTESHRAYRKSLHEQYAKNPDVQEVEWVTFRGPRTCLACLALDQTRYPISSPPEHFHVNCFAPGTPVNGPEVLGSTRRRYEGKMAHIVTASGKELTVTPNHPILTTRGWVAAGGIVQGDDLVNYRPSQGPTSVISPDYEHVQPSIEDVFHALNNSFHRVSRKVPSAAVNFHGEISCHDVDVVTANSFLQSAIYSQAAHPAEQFSFFRANMRLANLSRFRSLFQLFKRSHSSPDSRVSSRRQSQPLFRRGVSHALKHRFRTVSRSDTGPLEPVHNNGSSHPEFFRYGLDGLPGLMHGNNPGDVNVANPGLVHTCGLEDFGNARTIYSEVLGYVQDRLPGDVSLDRVIFIDRIWHEGHVYNLETTTGWYIADSIITHNCRCTTVAVPYDPYGDYDYLQDVDPAEDWLRQNANRAQFPSQEAYDGFIRGDLGLQDFLGYHDDPVWGRTIYQKSGRQALNAKP